MGLQEILDLTRELEPIVCHRCGESSSNMAYVLTPKGWECVNCTNSNSPRE